MNDLSGIQQTWLFLSATIGAITLVWNFYSKTLKEIKKAFNEPLITLDKKLDIAIEDIDNKVDSIVDSFRNSLAEIDNMIIERDAKNELIKEALVSMERQLILNACEDALEKGYADNKTRETLSKQVHAYKDLGGNSFVEDLVEEVEELPRKK